MLDVAAGAGEKVVDAQHFRTVGNQAIAEMRPEETGTTDDQHAFRLAVSHILYSR